MGDGAMSEYLRKANSKLTIFEVYGLFYGCLAAPNLVMPSWFYPLIFGEEGAGFESEEEATEIVGNLMSLWNVLAQWRPGKDRFIFPDAKYPMTDNGMAQRTKDDYSLIEYFVKGLDLGETRENDFSEDGVDALKALSETQAFLDKYGELIEKEPLDDDTEETLRAISGLENIIADCVARISTDLKRARPQVSGDMRKGQDAKKKASQAESAKISRNEPCPCGSGKKYKKCCGLSH